MLAHGTRPFEDEDEDEEAAAAEIADETVRVEELRHSSLPSQQSQMPSLTRECGVHWRGIVRRFSAS